MPQARSPVVAALKGKGLNRTVVKDNGTAEGAPISRAGNVPRVDIAQRMMLHGSLEKDVQEVIKQTADTCTNIILESGLSYDLAVLFVFDQINNNLAKGGTDEARETKKELKLKQEENEKLRRELEAMRAMMAEKTEKTEKKTAPTDDEV